MSEKSVTLSSRIAGILEQLNSGSTIHVKDLAQQYSVSERTIQKDLNERLDPSLIDSVGNGSYRLIPGCLGNITPDDIKEFSKLSGIIDLYPDIDDVIRHKIRDSLIVKSSVNSGCIPGADEFKEINFTIANSKKLRFDYNGKSNVIEPYKLLNHSGIWYLLGLNAGVVKSYCIHKMSRVRRDIQAFDIDQMTMHSIESNPSPWFRADKVTVKLNIKPSFVSYFRDRNIIQEIKSEEIREDGSLTISLELNSIEEIKGTIKFWLPNIDVVEPIALRDSIIKDIKSFL